jgi:hypothetical protein
VSARNHAENRIETTMPNHAPHSSLRSRALSIGALCAALIVTALASASSAFGAYGISAFDVQVLTAGGGTFTQAGGHPDEIATQVDLNAYTDPVYGPGFPDGSPKDIAVDLPPGLLGNPRAVGKCTTAELTGSPPAGGLGEGGYVSCPPGSQVGYVVLRFNFFIDPRVPLYAMEPATGEPARFGFEFAQTPIFIRASLRSESDYGITLGSYNIPEALPLIGTDIVFWGDPADPVHDPDRGVQHGGLTPCLAFSDPTECSNPSGLAEQAFLSIPTSCMAPGSGLPFTLFTDSWPQMGDFKERTIATHLAPSYPEPPEAWGPQKGTEDCDRVPFTPDISLEPGSQSAETPTGLKVELTVPSEGLLNPDGISQAHLKKAIVKLPEGMTINPSAAEGLGVCSPAEYAAETLTSAFGDGCPGESKIGSVRIDTPLLPEPIEGSLFQAQQDDPNTPAPGAENPFDSLLALYIVAKDPEQGILIKLAGKVQPDPQSGRIVTTFDDLPQQPFSKFTLRFREGQRAVLTTPPTCGKHEVESEFVPWSAQDPDNPLPGEVLKRTSDVFVTSGVNGGPCPPDGVPPFKPGFEAGSNNNNAGSFSPFGMRLTRADGEQDMTKFSAVLPPGVSAKIAGVGKCPEAAIALAKTKTGKQELASPSCPANSQIGHILAGGGVGSVLTYVPGKLYLAGPYAGAPLSVVAITAAVAGPFDVGTVVNREALTLNPRTGQVNVDGEKSDPIPHILEGIPLKVRDVRIYVDRPNFTINPTSCNPFQVAGTLWGSFLDPLNPADDVGVAIGTRYQAANCLNLGFRPKLSLNLRGGTKRGDHPALRAVLKLREGDANVGGAQVTLPSSAFLDQARIRTICTRVQFAQDQCPEGSIYGYARAFTPLLDDPLQGPVYLRSSSHKLPDLVAALHGFVDIDLVGKIDSFKGGIRTTFEDVPDAPATKFILAMQGGKKGLVVNSRDLCAGKNRAKAHFVGQNGKAYDFRPVVRASCGGK